MVLDGPIKGGEGGYTGRGVEQVSTLNELCGRGVALRPAGDAVLMIPPYTGPAKGRAGKTANRRVAVGTVASAVLATITLECRGSARSRSQCSE